MTTAHAAAEGGTGSKDKTKGSAGGVTPQAGSNPGTVDEPKVDKSLVATPVEVSTDSGSDPGTVDIGKNDGKGVV